MGGSGLGSSMVSCQHERVLTYKDDDESSMCRQEQVAGETLSVMVGSTEPAVQKLGVKSWLFHMNYVTLNYSGSFSVRRTGDDDDDSFTQTLIRHNPCNSQAHAPKRREMGRGKAPVSAVLCLHLQSHSPL